MQISPGSRVVIDTNVWISFLIGKFVSQLEKEIIDKSLLVLYSDELLLEILEVLSRRKFKKYFPDESTDAIIKLMKTAGLNVKVKTSVSYCNDPKDDFILALCYDGNADYLITGDNDLLSIKEFFGTRIITYKRLIS